MGKTWKKAPWSIRLLFLYWISPLLLTFLSMMFVAFMLPGFNFIGILRLPFDLLSHQYEAMPVSTSVDVSLSLMYFSSAYFAWRLLRGSGFSRAVLEMFSWISIATTSIALIFPELKFIEVEHLSSEAINVPIQLLALGVFVLGLEIIVLYALRSSGVKVYANAF